MSAVAVSSSSDSGPRIGVRAVEDTARPRGEGWPSDDEIIIPGVPRASKAKRLFVLLLVAAAGIIAGQKLGFVDVRPQLAKARTWGRDVTAGVMTKPAPAAPAASPVASAPALAPSSSPSAPAPAALAPEPLAPAPSTTANRGPASTGTTATAVPSEVGTIDTAHARPGRRVFVDGHVVGQTPRSMVVRCGAREVKVGSAGRARTVDVPCGESIAVGDF